MWSCSLEWFLNGKNLNWYWKEYCPAHLEVLLSLQDRLSDFCLHEDYVNLGGNYRELWGLSMVVKTRQNCLSPLTHKQYLFQIGNSRTASIIVYAVTDMGFPHSSISKESACNVGDLGSIPGSERPPGEGSGNPVLYSCLENPTSPALQVDSLLLSHQGSPWDAFRWLNG